MTDRQPSSLAGLLSLDASNLYIRLLESGGACRGSGSNEIDIESAAGRELREAGLLFGDPHDTERVKVVGLTTAIPLLISRAQAEITVAHRNLLNGWDALEAELNSAPDARESEPSANEGIAIIRDKAKVSALSADLYIGARSELCATITGHFHTPVRKHQLLVPPRTSLAGGARYRSIYDGIFAEHVAGSSIIESSRQAGEEVRIRATLPAKMLLVDNQVALIALTEPAVHASAVVRSPRLLAVLSDWFELLWEDSGTTGGDTAPVYELTAQQRRIVRLLATSMSDDAIARATGMSVRSVRRHVTAILDVLGVDTRFAAGVAAARRGWL